MLQADTLAGSVEAEQWVVLSMTKKQGCPRLVTNTVVCTLPLSDTYILHLLHLLLRDVTIRRAQSLAWCSAACCGRPGSPDGCILPQPCPAIAPVLRRQRLNAPVGGEATVEGAGGIRGCRMCAHRSMPNPTDARNNTQKSMIDSDQW